MVGPVIGIDVGSSYTCVGVYKDGRVQIIANEFGHRTTPSYIAFIDGGRLIGERARDQATLHPSNTIFAFKRLLGRSMEEEEVQQALHELPYQIINSDNRPVIAMEVNGTRVMFSPEALTAMLLVKMKETAEAFLVGQQVTTAILTIPSSFSDAQRQAMKDAAMLAGLTVLRLVEEPIAAALAYGLDKTFNRKTSNILVYHLGGRTLDVSILHMDEGVFEMLAIKGDPHLGGNNFDQRLFQHFLKLIKHRYGMDISHDTVALHRLRAALEKAKRSLSTTHQVVVRLDSLCNGTDLEQPLTRTTFERVTDDLFHLTLSSIQQALEASGLNISEIRDILLVGGSTNIPRVRQLVEDIFGGKEANRGINPDEAAAYGAALVGAVVIGESYDEMMGCCLDVTPLSIGIETSEGVMMRLIERNSLIPNSKTRSFSLSELPHYTHGNRSTIFICLYQGERYEVIDNFLLDCLNLTDVHTGHQQVVVTVNIDNNGIIHLKATDNATGISEIITITADKGRLSAAEIDAMLKSSEDFALQDEAAKEVIDAKNTLEGFAYSLRGQLEDKQQLGGRISEEMKIKLDDAVQDALEWLDDNPTEAMETYKDKKKQLEEILASKLAEENCDVYAATEHEDL